MDIGGNAKKSTGGEATRGVSCSKSSRRASTRRNGIALQELSHKMGSKSTVHRGMVGNQTSAKTNKMSYEDIREIMEKKLANLKGGLSNESNLSDIVKEWHDEREIIDLDRQVVEMEAKKLLERWEKYNVPTLGDVPSKKQEGVWRFMSSQLNGMAGKETRETKIGEITNIINRYDVNLFAGMELGVNWRTLKAQGDLQHGFLQKENLGQQLATTFMDPQ